MRILVVAVLAVVMLGLGVSAATAADPMLICPDRLVSEIQARRSGMCPDRLVPETQVPRSGMCPDRLVPEVQTQRSGMCPDRLVPETLAMPTASQAYLPYTPFARYSFGKVSGQLPPDRVMADRLSTGVTHQAVHGDALQHARHAPWCFCDQVSPDLVRAERVECGMCVY